jgi:hypothetical protein
MIRLASILMVFAASATAAEPLLRFERSEIGNVTYEASSVFDVDKDGHVDIVCGEYWFAGPSFRQQHKITDIMRVDDYYDDFSNYPLDVNGDGYKDIITGGWWGATLAWRENPQGKTTRWQTHAIAKAGNIETTRFWDVDGDGHVELCPNAGGKIAVYKLFRGPDGKPIGKFQEFVLKDGGCGHGLGFGDVNGDGRGDFIAPKGWLEAPERPFEQEWTWHEEFNLASASVPIIVHDVDKDDKADLIVGQAHAYGLHWWKQYEDHEGNRKWARQVIDPDRSQYHDLQLVDIDNDDEPELITGKRYRAHLGRDPGSGDAVGLYYFEIRGGEFKRVTLDYGRPGEASGAGIYFWVADVDNNGWKDIVAPGKEGLFLFKNFGPLDDSSGLASSR